MATNKFKLIILTFLLGIFPCFGALVTVTDTLFNADGTFAQGYITISWPAFTSGITYVPPGSKIVTIGSNGVFTTQLYPNDTALPVGSLYVISYNLNGSPSPPPVFYWDCPTSGSTITIPTCQTNVIANPSGVVNISQLSPPGMQGACIISTGTVWTANTQPDCWNYQAAGVPSQPCAVGQSYFQTDATAGSNLWLCTIVNTWSQITASGGGGASYQSVTFGATPTYNGGSGVVKTFATTLTGNITSCTATAFSTGQIFTMRYTQDVTGGRSVACSFLIGLQNQDGTASSICSQTFVFDGTNGQALGLMLCTGTGKGGFIIPEGTAISGVSSNSVISSVSSNHRLEMNLNNAGQQVIPGTSTTAATSGHCVQYGSNGLDLTDSGAACSSGGITTLSNGYYSTPFPITGQEASLTLSSSANVVTCWSRAWPVNQTLSSVQGNEFGSVATSNHYAFAIYSGGNLVQQSGTVTAHNSSNSPFTATFSAPPTMTNSEAVDFCTTADGSGSIIIGMIDASGTSTFIQLINQGSQKLVFTAANPSTGTTTLTFPSTLGATKTAVTLAWPTVAAFQ